MQRSIIQLFRILISILFVFSAISKILSLSFFDGLVGELFLGNQYYDRPAEFYWIQIFTRLIIAGELLLAVAILHNFLLKQLVLPIIQVMLIAFTIHLTYMGFEKGFIGGNCGCFGDLIPMDNFESIIKNVISILMVAYVQRFYNKHQNLTFKSWVPIFIVGGITFSTLFLTVKEYKQTEITEVDYDKKEIDTLTSTTPIIFIDTISQSQKDTTKIKDSLSTENTIVLKKDSILKSQKVEKSSQEVVKKITIKKQNELSKYTDFSTGKVDLNQGDKLICMFSLTCGHCQDSYKELVECEKQNKIPSMYLLCYGKETDLNYFFSQAEGKHPYMLLSDYEDFQRLLEGSDFPKILHHKEGKTLKFWDLETYKISNVKKHLGIKQIKKETKNTIIEPQGGGLFDVQTQPEFKW